MGLRVAFDLDGVLADLASALATHSTLLFGTPPSGTPNNDAPRLRLAARQQRQLWKHVESIENFWETLDEIEPGFVRRLAELAAARRWEVIFLTKRPGTSGALAQIQSQRWLENKGFSLPSVYVVRRSRGAIAAALGLDVFVDDRPENCLEVSFESKARAILVAPPDTPVPGVARLRITVVRSMDACVDALMAMDRPSGLRTRFFERLMRIGVVKGEPAA